MGLVEVKYVGLSDERIITKKNWEQEGVAMPQDTVWDASNRRTLLIDGTDRMLEVLKAQGHFRVSEVTDDNQNRTIIEASDPEREADIVVDGNTGQRSERPADSQPVENPEATSGGGSTDTTGRTGRGSSTGGTGSSGGSAGRGSSTSGTG
jgi:uncharacterized membrane protein YgcG